MYTYNDKSTLRRVLQLENYINNFYVGTKKYLCTGLSGLNIKTYLKCNTNT